MKRLTKRSVITITMAGIILIVLVVILGMLIKGNTSPGDTTKPTPGMAKEPTKIPTQEPIQEPTPTPTPTNTPIPTKAVEAKAVKALALEQQLSRIEEYEGRYIYRSSYPNLYVAVDQDNYQALREALKEYDANLETQMNNRRDYLLPIARELSDRADFEYFSSDVRVSMERADSVIVSLLEHRYETTDAGYEESYDGINMNSMTGEAVTLTEVVTDLAKLPMMLVERLVKEYPSLEEAGLLPLFEKRLADDYRWTLGYQGITFYFTPSDIAHAIEDVLPVYIAFRQEPTLFSEEYTKVPDTYAMMLQGNQTRYFEDEEGEPYPLTFSYTMHESEYPEYKSIIVETAEGRVEEELYACDYSAYFIHTASGVDYVYADITSENDYHDIYVFEVRDGKPSMSTVIHGEGICYDSLTDPTSFCMERRIDLLSTYSGIRRYCVGEDGSPVPIEESYEIQSTVTITSKTDLTVHVLSFEQGKPLEEETVITAGTEFTLLSTNVDSYVDASLPDGRIVRLFVEWDDWTPFINGMDSYDCFDGMQFAG